MSEMELCAMIEKLIMASDLDCLVNALSVNDVRRIAGVIAAGLAPTMDEMEQTFDLRWKADMRAIARWREANPGNELVMPDHADLVVWLMNEVTVLTAERDRLREALDQISVYAAAYDYDLAVPRILKTALAALGKEG